ncbi:hypothetical protein PAXRUDRAFT_22297 [Paxillus rubicundulus Ve08.2h10]|uniref:Uncharacterized protein n=1 Tax=Paxillus rubicundulus Ve08.2h10 TaxID=930991 RepID=A0A0D0D5L8_9AGAM|nr:hypothetical protein PAXRUDRAFT_22297 [Paxillus rubicundulus Ve08.2h10]
MRLALSIFGNIAVAFKTSMERRKLAYFRVDHFTEPKSVRADLSSGRGAGATSPALPTGFYVASVD